MTGQIAALAGDYIELRRGLGYRSPARNTRCGPSPGTWTRTDTTARSRWRRSWTGRHRPSPPTRATRPGAWRWCVVSCATRQRGMAPPRSPRPGCSARPGTAGRRMCIPTRDQRLAAGRRRARPARRAAPAQLRHAVRADRLHRGVGGGVAPVYSRRRCTLGQRSAFFVMSEVPLPRAAAPTS